MNDLTYHAAVRSQQRGIPPLIIDLVVSYGKMIQRRGASVYFLDKLTRRNRKKIGSIAYRRLDDLLDAYVVVADDGAVVTKFKLRVSDSTPDLMIEQLGVSLEGNGILSKVANCALKILKGERIEAKVQAILHRSFASMMKEMTNKYGVMQVDEFTLKSDLANYNFEDVSWNETHIMCTFHASGVLSVELE